MSESDEFDFSALESMEDELDFGLLDVESSHMHEMFMSFQKAGFTENQALKLVALLTNGIDDHTIFLVDGDGGEE